jgi:hypothetical protein
MFREDEAKSQYVIFFHTTEQQWYNAPATSKCLESYSQAKQVLLIKMKTGAHEMLVDNFVPLLYKQLENMGVSTKKLLSIGGKTMKGSIHVSLDGFGHHT